MAMIVDPNPLTATALTIPNLKPPISAFPELESEDPEDLEIFLRAIREIRNHASSERPSVE